jgi:hypothetical protein
MGIERCIFGAPLLQCQVTIRCTFGDPTLQALVSAAKSKPFMLVGLVLWLLWLNGLDFILDWSFLFI